MINKYASSADAIRQLIELAISSGRNWQSPQTGYIHYCYAPSDEDLHNTIPVYENLLFALALMRSRNAENVIEAKEFLSKILEFQVLKDGPSLGNFPVYLHEYPYCKDRLFGAHLLSPLYWMYKNFHHVLGAELKEKLESSLLLLVHYCLQTHSEKEAPYHLAWKIAAGVKAVGQELKEDQIEAGGDALISYLKYNFDSAPFYSPSTAADLLIAYQMIYSSLSSGEMQEAWGLLESFWHYPTLSYCGPGIKEFQKGSEPQPTLYDFFLGYFSKMYSYRCFADHPVQLQAALIHPIEDQMELPVYPIESEGKIEGMDWKNYQTPFFGYSLIAKRKEMLSSEKCFVPLKVVWGEPVLLHSFVCQGGNIDAIDFSANGQSIEMIVTLNNTIPPEQKEKRQELCFFFDESPHAKTTVDGQVATTFQVGEEVVVFDQNMHIALNFEVIEGEGRFFGHIMKGNRPSQTSSVGKKRFDVFDKQIFLRSVERTALCVIKVTIELNATAKEF